MTSYLILIRTVTSIEVNLKLLSEQKYICKQCSSSNRICIPHEGDMCLPLAKEKEKIIYVEYKLKSKPLTKIKDQRLLAIKASCAKRNLVNVNCQSHSHRLTALPSLVMTFKMLTLDSVCLLIFIDLLFTFSEICIFDIRALQK